MQSLTLHFFFKQRTTTHFLKHLQYCSMAYRPKQTFLLFNNTRQHTSTHLGFKALDKQFHILHTEAIHFFFKQHTTTHFLKHLQYSSISYKLRQYISFLNNTRQHTSTHLGFKALDKQFHILHTEAIHFFFKQHTSTHFNSLGV